MADQNFMDLASKTASGITGTDYMMLVNNSEAYKALVNDVAEAILGKLTSKSFSGLETTAKNVIGALNELNSKRCYCTYIGGNISTECKIICSDPYQFFLVFFNARHVLSVINMNNGNIIIHDLGTAKVSTEKISNTEFKIKYDAYERAMIISYNIFTIG